MASLDGNYLAHRPAEQKKWRQRLIRITRASLDAASLTSVANEESVTHERIRQIVRETLLMSMTLPKKRVRWSKGWFSLKSIRAEPEFWRGRLDALERHWKLPPAARHQDGR